MNHAELLSVAIDLGKGRVRRLTGEPRQRLEVLSGNLWVTVDNDLRDRFVAAGEALTLDRSGETLVSALDDSSFVLLESSDTRRDR